MSNSKSVKESVDKMEDSPMDTSSDDSSSSSNEMQESESPPVYRSPLVTSNPLLMDMLLPDSNHLPPPKQNREIQLQQNLNEALHPKPVSDESSSSLKPNMHAKPISDESSSSLKPNMHAKPISDESSSSLKPNMHERPVSDESSSSLKKTSPSRSGQEFLMLFDRSDSSSLAAEPESCQPNESPISRKLYEEQMHRDCSESLKSKMHARHVLDEESSSSLKPNIHARPVSDESSSSLKKTSPSRSGQEFMMQFDRSDSSSLAAEPESCQPNEPLISRNPSEELMHRDCSESLQSEMHAKSISDNASTSKNRPEVEKEPTSKHQSQTEDGSADYYPSFSSDEEDG